MSLDYKRAAYGRADADVREFLKDVSSFANTAGGHLVIGMDEATGVASALTPLEGDPDQELLRLENLMRDGIEPRITGIRARAIAIATGGFAIVIRVPRSWNPPHRVSARNANRFYVRNSGGSHEVSVEELRSLFTLGATAHDRVRAFRFERLAKISAGDTSVRLAAELGRIVLHIVPLSAVSSGRTVDLVQAHQLQNSLRPIAAMGFTPRFNFDGFINVRGGARCAGYTQLFRNGSIEAVKMRTVVENQGRRIIPSIELDRHTLEVIPLYLSALRALDVPPPLVIMLTLQDIHGAVLGVDHDQLFFDPPEPIAQSVLELPEIMIADYGTEQDYQRAVRPAYDALWNAGGYSASQYFNDDNTWTGPRRR